MSGFEIAMAVLLAVLVLGLGAFCVALWFMVRIDHEGRERGRRIRRRMISIVSDEEDRP